MGTLCFIVLVAVVAVRIHKQPPRSSRKVSAQYEGEVFHTEASTSVLAFGLQPSEDAMAGGELCSVIDLDAEAEQADEKSEDHAVQYEHGYLSVSGEAQE